MADRPFRPADPSRRAALAGLGGCAVACAIPAGAVAPQVVETITLSLADGRALAIELLHPPGGGTLDAIFFSHGANAAPDRYRALTGYWAAHGFLVVSPLHLDSEIHPARETKDQGRVLRTRIADMDAIKRGLIERTLLPPALAARVRGRVPIAAGHSYGAYLAQIMGGATAVDPAGGGVPLASAVPGGVGAIVALSPPPALPGFSPPQSWATIAAPMLVETGTRDMMPPFVANWEQHLDSYHAAPGALAWGAVYDGIDHYFNGVICRPDPRADARSRAQVRRFAALSLAFVAFARQRPGAAERAAFARRLAALCDRPLQGSAPAA